MGKSRLYVDVESQDIEAVKLLLSRKFLDINSKSFEESYFKLVLSESEQLIMQEKVPEIVKMIDSANERITHTKKEEQSLLKNINIDTNITDEKDKKPINLTNDKEIKALLKKQRH